MNDHDRTLNERGRYSAAVIGRWLKSNGFIPNLVQSSDSARTKETWELVEKEIASGASVQWHEKLYHARAQTMLNVLQTAEKHDTVLMLGHNPGIAMFAEMILRHLPSHSQFMDYPTAATTIIQFGVDAWADVDWRQGDALDFAIPRELDGL